MRLDFHSHILPGLDDGATDLQNAVQLVSAMKDWGFERIACTPHITNKYRNTPETIRPVFETLQEELDRQSIGIEICMSAEYRLVPETWPEVLEKNWLMPIEDRFIIMELPIFNPSDIGDIDPLEEFRKIISLGLTPVLPHPERYLYLSRRELMDFLEAGVKIQSNYGSLAGLYGDIVKQNARCLVDEGLVSYYGTDMHNLQYVKIIGEWFASGNPLAEFQDQVKMPIG